MDLEPSGGNAVRARQRRAPGGAASRVVRLACAASLVLAALLAGCHDSEGCDPGEPCGCTGGTECYLGCAGNGCQQECYGVATTCGTVCNDGCNSVCHDVTDCTASCGNGCMLSCYSVSSCGAICGDDCNYACTSVSSCGVQVGPGSVVACTSVSTCDVVCTGSCHVTCSDVNTCNVQCQGGGGPTTCPDGRQACGAC